MPPLAETQFQFQLEQQHHHGFQQTQPATAFSCAAPITHSSLPAPVRLSTSLTHTSHRSSSGSLSKSSSTSLAALHAVEGSVRAILLFLEIHGLSTASVEELHDMLRQERLIEVMDRVEYFIECMRDPSWDLEAINTLYIAAWTSIRDYSKSCFKEAQHAYSRNQNKHWEEFIVQQRLSDWQQERRKQRQMMDFNPELEQELKARLQRLTFLKISCEKGLILAKEWTRFLRAQQKC